MRKRLTLAIWAALAAGPLPAQDIWKFQDNRWYQVQPDGELRATLSYCKGTNCVLLVEGKPTEQAVPCKWEKKGKTKVCTPQHRMI